MPRIKELFKRLFERRLLVRLVGVRFSHLVGGGYQMNMFEESQELSNLYSAMDHIRQRFGDRSVLRCSLLGGKNHWKNKPV